MGNQLFTYYYKNKLKTIFQYSIILDQLIKIDNNKLWKNTKQRDTLFKSVIEIYFPLIVNNIEINKKYLAVFIDLKLIKDLEIDLEIKSIIDYFINNKIIFDLKDYQNEARLLAIILKVANKLDIITSPYYQEKVNENNYIKNELKKYEKFDFLSLNDNKEKIDLLTELVKTNIRKERKINTSITDLKSFNSYINIANDNNYLAQYNYNIISLKDYDLNAINLVNKNKAYNDDFALVSADLIVGTLIKLISLRKRLKSILLPLNASFFNDERKVRKLSELFKNNLISQYLKVLINYKDLSDKIIMMLKKYRISYCVFCDNSCVDINNLDHSHNNYFFSKEYFKRNAKYKTVLNNKFIIIESYDGIITENVLLSK